MNVCHGCAAAGAAAIDVLAGIIRLFATVSFIFIIPVIIQFGFTNKIGDDNDER